jgi:hypothetical protein
VLPGVFQVPQYPEVPCRGPTAERANERSGLVFEMEKGWSKSMTPLKHLEIKPEQKYFLDEFLSLGLPLRKLE